MGKFSISKFNFIFLHLFSFVLVFGILYLFKFINILPNLTNLLNWDAAYYFDISSKGYQSPYSENHNTAFFPLLPFFIYFFNLNGVNASIFNLILFYISLYLVFDTFKIKQEQKLFIISFPSFVYCFIPYTEGLFLFFSTVFLIGLHKKNMWFIILGILFSSITRTSALVFIPAFIFLCIIDLLQKNRSHIKFYVSGIISSIIGTLIVYVIQYIQTGVWFANFKVMKHWDRVFSLPSLKLTTWGEFNLLWLDTHSYLYFIISIVFILYIIYNVIYKTNNVKINGSELYSFAYLTLIGLTVLLYSPKAYETYTTIFGLNRYVFCTAFFVFAIIYILNTNNLLNKVFIYFFIFGIIIIFIQFYRFESYYLLGQNIEKYSLKYFIYFLLCAIYFMIPFIFKYLKKQYYVIFIINIFLQVYLFNLFINREWIG